MRQILMAVALAVAAVTLFAQSHPTRPAGPVILVLTDGSRVRGVLVSVDEEAIVIRIGKDSRGIPIDQVAPLSVYLAKRQVVDLSKPDTHVQLGQYLLENGLAPQARKEFYEAVRLDPSLRAKVKEILASSPATAPASAPAPAGPASAKSPAPAKTTEEPKVIKYQPATTQQAEAATKLFQDWAKKAAAFVPTLHEVQTPHFVIYSAWDRGNDKPLADICEKMYAAMCRQFDIPPAENIWVGKCAIFVFWEKDHFRKFSLTINRGNPNAAGYCGHNGDGSVFIVMGPCRSKNWFYELLVHESTHGFISRYLTNRGIPLWLNEGLAEYMAAKLVDDTVAAQWLIYATKKAIKEKIDVSYVLKSVGERFDYGIAQSFVQYLIARDHKAFIKFVTLIKEGKSEEEAMKEAYNMTMNQFLREWAAAAAEAVKPRRGR